MRKLLRRKNIQLAVAILAREHRHGLTTAVQRQHGGVVNRSSSAAATIWPSTTNDYLAVHDQCRRRIMKYRIDSQNAHRTPPTGVARLVAANYPACDGINRVRARRCANQASVQRKPSSGETVGSQPSNARAEPIGTPPSRIVERHVDRSDRRVTATEPLNQRHDLVDRHLLRIADVHRTSMAGLRQRDRARLFTVAGDGERFPGQPAR